MPPKKRKRIKTKSVEKTNRNKNKSEKTPSDSESDKPQCSRTKNKKTTPLKQSDSDNDTSYNSPAPTLNTNTKSATINKNSQREPLPSTLTDSNMKPKTQYNVSTSNSYESLNEETNNMESEEISENTENKPPPPIIIHQQITNHKTLVQQIKETVNSTFSIKYTKNTTNITINNRDQRTLYMNTLQKDNIEFHTYTDKPDKTHAFVIRGLAEDVTTEEVIEYLKTAYNITVISCHNMKFTKYNTKPLMLLITKNDLTLATLQNRVKYIVHTRVQIERRRSTRKTVQCHNCQNWEHPTSNCHAKVRCMYCAGQHSSKNCETKTTLKCANCDGKHAANDIICTTYIQRVEWMEASRNNRKKTQPKPQYLSQAAEFPEIKYSDAPAPKHNYWHERHQQQQRQQQQPQQDQQQQQTPQQLQQQTPQQPEQQTSNPRHTHPPPTYTGQPPTIFQQLFDSFRELMCEFSTLHTLVNIDGMLRAIKSLNAQLKESTSPIHTFTIFTKFTDTLGKYNI